MVFGFPVVAIPARNEAARLGPCLAALLSQRSAGPFGVLVVANNCTDDTAAVGRAWQPRFTAQGLELRIVECRLPAAQANIVGARRAALDLAAQWAGPGGLLLSTDADSRAAPGWLAALLGALVGADAAAGRILLDPHDAAPLTGPLRRTHLLDAAYRQAAAHLTARLDPLAHDPWPGHAQHFGANLALSVQAYRAVGGLPQVTALEDVALVQALLRADLRLRHTPHARVYTSARLGGRVACGLSTQLTEWASAASPDGWTVPGGAEVAALAQIQAQFRQAYTGHACPRMLAHLWQMSLPALSRALAAPTLGRGLELAHQAREGSGLWAVRHRPVPVAQALAELRLRLSEFYRVRHAQQRMTKEY